MKGEGKGISHRSLLIEWGGCLARGIGNSRKGLRGEQIKIFEAGRESINQQQRGNR